MKKITSILTLLTYICLDLITANPSAMATSHQANKTPKGTQTKSHPEPTLANTLNWIVNKSNKNLCNGSFEMLDKKELKNPNPLPDGSTSFTTTADNFKYNHQSGKEVLTGNVKLFQPDDVQASRITKTDKAIIQNDNDDNKTITLPYPLSIEDFNSLTKAKSGTIHTTAKKTTSTLHQAKFRFKNQPNKKISTPPITYWGTAKTYIKRANGNIELTDATCSTCNPTHPSWSLHAKKIIIHHQKKYAEASNMTLYFHHIPVFYLPYIIFPTDTSRHSGLLSPSITYSKNKGFVYQQPIYWNIAPNYDATITPGFYSKKGLQINTLFRYLTPNSNGNLYVSIFPSDKGFKKYKQDISQQGITGKDEYLKQLSDASTNRGYISMQSNMNITSKLKANVNINYATDPYYLRDYSVDQSLYQTNQLYNSLNLTYSSTHWNVYNTFQTIQVLHRIDSTAISDQYQRLPEIDFNGNYDHVQGPLFFNLDGQYVNFAYHSAFTPLTKDMPIGNRLHLKPQIGAKFSSAYGYITPSISLDTTAYRSQLAQIASARSTFDKSRATPITSIDSGLYFEKSLQLKHKQYWQTLEPRLKYTYIPYKNQDAFPNFDTTTPTPGFSTLFSDNAFSSFDRLQNTSQLSLGISSRLLQQKDASQILEADAGLAYYQQPQKVCLTNNCTPVKAHVSPFYTQLTFNPTGRLSLTGATAWNIKDHYLDNASATVTYTGEKNNTMNVSYIENHNSSNIITAGISRSINKNLSALGYINYDIHNKRPQSYFFGLQYDTCCWTTQLVLDQEYAGIDPQSSANNPQSRYNRSIYIQFMLKGLGSFGKGNAADLLATNLPGFSNPFKQNT
jgi:LPS-assembly protein